MITTGNIKEVINSLSKKDQERLKNSDKEYCVLQLHVSNVGYVVIMTLTNNYNRYKNISNNGNCILEINDVLSYLN